jgi:hypothetical protein
LLLQKASKARSSPKRGCFSKLLKAPKAHECTTSAEATQEVLPELLDELFFFFYSHPRPSPPRAPVAALASSPTAAAAPPPSSQRQCGLVPPSWWRSGLVPFLLPAAVWPSSPTTSRPHPLPPGGGAARFLRPGGAAAPPPSSSWWRCGLAPFLLPMAAQSQPRPTLIPAPRASSLPPASAHVPGPKLLPPVILTPQKAPS